MGAYMEPMEWYKPHSLAWPPVQLFVDAIWKRSLRAPRHSRSHTFSHRLIRLFCTNKAKRWIQLNWIKFHLRCFCTLKRSNAQTLFKCLSKRIYSKVKAMLSKALVYCLQLLQFLCSIVCSSSITIYCLYMTVMQRASIWIGRNEKNKFEKGKSKSEEREWAREHKSEKRILRT